MIKKKYIYNALVICLFIGAASACKKPYNPTIVSSTNSYLVVEGVINSGSDSTIIKLSKTVNVSGNVKLNSVGDALVTVEGEENNSYLLQPAGAGQYVSAGLNLDISKKYRLHIVLNGKDYASDYEVVKPNPPIDSITFAPAANDQLQISANTHDPTNNTRYYRWDYTEAWRFHALYVSSYILDTITKDVRARRQDEQSYYCFANDVSSTIVIGSSAKLAQDVIFQGPITTIASSSEKIELRYSILVKQYALTKEAYQFWENLKKNTEQLGSIFDAQPTQLTGNIHNTADPTEPVVGYISITNTQSQRIFIDRKQLPKSWALKYPYNCSVDSALYFNPKSMQHEVEQYIVNGGGIPINSITAGSTIIGYTYSYDDCADCRIRGKVKAPAFWTGEQ